MPTPKRNDTEVALSWQEIVVLMGLITQRVEDIDIFSVEYEIHREIMGDAFAKLATSKDVITKGWRACEDE